MNEVRLIDANALKERLLVLRNNINNVQCTSDIFDICLTEVSNTPTIPQTIITEFKGCDNCELERPKGEWKETGYETGALGITYRQTQCSNCGWEHALPMRWNFCPNCGADMRGKEE